MKIIFILLLTFNSTFIINVLTTSCTYKDFFIEYFENTIVKNITQIKPNLYILYEVNPSEGFNLRRDVYIRMAVFLKNLKTQDKFKSAKLVLPPFTKLFHWKSHDIQQDFITWKHFFDLDSLSIFTDIIDYDDFLEEIGLTFEDPLTIDIIFQLQHFKEMFENGVFIDKFKIEACDKKNFNIKSVFNKWNCIERKFLCLKFQGTTKLLLKVINFAYKTIRTRPAIIMFLNAEIFLHEQWGSQKFWMARRSMRFNKNLVEEADKFRLKNFNSTNNLDLVQRPHNWKDEIYYRGAKGGPYLCAHLRRGDFLNGRENLIPTLKSAAIQIKGKLKELNYTKVFLSSDCTKEEFNNFRSYLNKIQVYKFQPEPHQLYKIKDGTFESTFTYRIQEEREILGFRKNLTFNTFCKNEDLSNCQRNAVWPIVY
ncbi:GDP-fucose protein O-fucosyltransferase 2 isoform X2 [Condylostylus longicornis]|uniref:GDP-fucose protein O-fucosyltransferase 2 isoform X2 n=1 Tax=Condylostylus longicornis TaxID=2530218 RepID=UPI00244DD483|nr:GDP-fucose protein O-fucosyltransferase 2 isoform X2 [Condylostylus longicornis]